MEFKRLVKLYLIRALAIVFSMILFFAGPMSCAALSASNSAPIQIIGYLVGVIGLVGGFVLLAIAYAAKHYLFKDAYTDRVYSRNDSNINFTYGKKHRWF